VLSQGLGNLVSRHDDCDVVFTSSRKGFVDETLTSAPLAHVVRCWETKTTHISRRNATVN
jgi:hypothetical protein